MITTAQKTGGSFDKNAAYDDRIRMKKTVLIIYSNLFDVSALALKNYLSDDGNYNVIAFNEKEYDSLRILRNFVKAYKYTYRRTPFFNNLLVNWPSAEVERKKDSDGNEVNFKPSSEHFARFRKLENICMRYDAEYTICTSQYAIKRAVLAREKYNLSGKIFALITDFDLQRNFINIYLDGYFVITEKTREALLEKGITEDKIFLINMPIDIDETYEEPNSKNIGSSKKKAIAGGEDDIVSKDLEVAEVGESTEEIRNKFNIRNKLPVITIVGGRYGSKYTHNALRDVAQFKDCNILVITNGNKSIYKKFSKWSKKNECTNNIYFADHVKGLESVYRITDYLIAAPTATICFEAIMHKIPLILMDSVNNVETKNSKYLISGGYAYSGISNERIKIAMAGYLKDLKTWRKHCESRFTNDGCEKFLQILDMIDAGVNPLALPDGNGSDDESDIKTIEYKEEKPRKRK